MKRDIAELWVAALESGEYRQAQKTLVVDDRGDKSYCCLGVLCDLANRAGVFVPGSAVNDWEYATDGATLPDVVIEWAGMKSNEGEFMPRPEFDAGVSFQWLLTGLNDSGSTFPEIAQVIRDKVEVL